MQRMLRERAFRPTVRARTRRALVCFLSSASELSTCRKSRPRVTETLHLPIVEPKEEMLNSDREEMLRKAKEAFEADERAKKARGGKGPGMNDAKMKTAQANLINQVSVLCLHRWQHGCIGRTCRNSIESSCRELFRWFVAHA